MPGTEMVQLGQGAGGQQPRSVDAISGHFLCASKCANSIIYSEEEKDGGNSSINVRPGHRGSEQQEADLTDVMSEDPLMKQVMSSRMTMMNDENE